MGLLDRVLSLGSNFSNLDGATPSVPNFKDSKYIVGDETLNPENLNLNPNDSRLDLDGERPDQYINNLPN